MAQGRLSAMWDQTDLLAVAAYNAPGIRKPAVMPGTFHPFKRRTRAMIGNELNHETAPQLYYQG